MELFFRLYFFGIDGAPFKVQNWVVQGLWDIGRSSVKLDYKLGWSPKTGTFKKYTAHTQSQLIKTTLEKIILQNLLASQKKQYFSQVIHSHLAMV